MPTSVKNIKGMPDLLPLQTRLWQYVEKTLHDVLDNFGYDEIRLPIVEYTELFSRSIGEVTDIVEKEMYTFPDRHDELLTLRPEGTAGCVRACLQNGLIANDAQQRLWYQGPMFRYENPQKGRQRQFHQLGVETFCIATPEIEVELISMISTIFNRFNLSSYVELELNTIGSAEARKNYKAALVGYLQNHKASLDEDCLRRLDTNPLRILDTKSPAVREILKNAPVLHDYIDTDSREHFSTLCHLLDAIGIKYRINHQLVRGLDYYNKTVFEWVTHSLGAQGTVCAGGRYDGLVEQLGGKPAPAVGFAIGLERLTLLLETIHAPTAFRNVLDIYFLIADDKEVYRQSIVIAEKLRKQSPQLRMIVHAGGGSFKSQMKKADKSGARLALIAGVDELNAGVISIKTMDKEYAGEQIRVDIDNLPQKINELLKK